MSSISNIEVAEVRKVVEGLLGRDINLAMSEVAPHAATLLELSTEYLAQPVGEIRHGLFVAFREGPRLLLTLNRSPHERRPEVLDPALIGGLGSLGRRLL